MKNLPLASQTEYTAYYLTVGVLTNILNYFSTRNLEISYLFELRKATFIYMYVTIATVFLSRCQDNIMVVKITSANIDIIFSPPNPICYANGADYYGHYIQIKRVDTNLRN